MNFQVLPMSNRSALAYWEHSRHKRSDVAREFKRITTSNHNQRKMLVRLEIDVENFDIQCEKNDDSKSTVFENHVESLLAGLRAIIGLGLGGRKNGSLLFWVADGTPAAISMVVPVCVFSKSRSDLHSVAVPDPQFLATSGFSTLLHVQAAEATATAWRERKNTALWRGSDTGHEEQFPLGSYTPRVHICLSAKSLRELNLVDAEISKVLHEECRSEFEAMGILGEYIPFAQFVRHKYLIDIDGYYCAWESMFLKLSSTSVVLKVQSDYEQWYYDRLVPWEHYIPVQHDLSDLETRVVWAREHDRACQQIAANAQLLMASLSFGHGLIDFGATVARILSSQDDG
jgi:hypothetical protein